MKSHSVRCTHSWDIMFNTLYLLTTLNISIQTMDCNNLQNSYVLRILFLWRGWLVGCARGGGVRNISSPLREVLNIFRRFGGGGGPNFMVEFWNTLHPPHPQYTYFMTGPLGTDKSCIVQLIQGQRVLLGVFLHRRLGLPNHLFRSGCIILIRIHVCQLE
jgi:hypothetical protein